MVKLKTQARIEEKLQMLKNAKSILVVLAVTLFVSLPSFADDSAFGGKGDTVWPLETASVEMVSENVIIARGQRGWQVDCYYVFRNTDKAITIQMGFPDAAEGAPSSDRNNPRYTIKDFRTWVNDEKKEGTASRQAVSQPTFEPSFRLAFPFLSGTLDHLFSISFLFSSFFLTDWLRSLAA